MDKNIGNLGRPQTAESSVYDSEAHFTDEPTSTSDESDSYESCVSEQESFHKTSSFQFDVCKRYENICNKNFSGKLKVGPLTNARTKAEVSTHLSSAVCCHKMLSNKWDSAENSKYIKRREIVENSDDNFPENLLLATSTHSTHQKSFQPKASLGDLLLSHTTSDEVRESPGDTKHNPSSFEFSKSETSSVTPVILLSRAEATTEIDEPIYTEGKCVSCDFAKGDIRDGSKENKIELKSKCDYSSAGNVKYQTSYDDENSCRVKKDSQFDHRRIKSFKRVGAENILRHSTSSQLATDKLSKGEYLRERRSCSFGKVKTCGESNRILTAVKDDDGQTDGPILTDVGVANGASHAEAGGSRPRDRSEARDLPEKCSGEGNVGKKREEKCKRLLDACSDWNIQIAPGPPSLECGVTKPEKVILDNELFETNSNFRERKLNKNREIVSQHFAKENKSVVRCRLSAECTDPQRNIIPPTITIGRSASFNEKCFVNPGEETQPCTRQRCHSTSSHRSCGEFFRFNNLKKFVRSPKRSKPIGMANASPAGSESSSINSNVENKKNKLMHQISSNIARKISKQGKREADSRESSHLDSKEFREAMASAAMACNGRTDSNPALVCYEELLKLFLCPICGQLMSPPLPQCRKGHLVCSECKLGTKNACPICKQRYAEGYNIMMGQVYQLLKLPCRFSPHGCARLLLQREKAAHEADCSYRPVCCHHAASGCPLQLPYKQMLEHISSCTYKQAS